VKPIYHETVNFNFCLAPMVGLSHVALRSIIQDYLPRNATTWWPTEMLNSRRIPGQVMGETDQTLKSSRDTVLVPQILGNEEKYIAKSVQMLEDYGVKGIDINMGCPVAKALKHNYGVSLMGDPGYASEVVAMTVRNTKLPVSVKIRAGEHRDQDLFFRFVEGLELAGASVICLHPRTQSQKRRGSADWDQIKILKQHLDIPIIGNGDVQVWEDAFKMKEETSCDGVMIGRALAARPWMLWQIGERLGFDPPIGKEGLKAPVTLEDEAYEYGKSLIQFIKSCFFYFENKEALKRIYFYIRVTSVWLNFGHSLNRRLVVLKNEEELILGVQKFFENDSLCFSRYTDLRY
jgi:nifR3 family TIM-barrel protein